MQYTSKTKLKTAFLASVLAFSIATPAFAAESHPFLDVNANYQEAVTALYNAEITNGINDTEFGVYNGLKRGDAAVILAKALGLTPFTSPKTTFQDINSRIEGYVNALTQAGIISGFSETEFAPNELLTRGQMAKILVNAYHLQEYRTNTAFTDLSKTFAADIEALYGAGITSGKTDVLYGTHSDITRGEFAVLLHKTMKFAEEQSSSQVKSVSTFNPITISIGSKIEELELPTEIEVIFNDNHTEKRNVQWDVSQLDLNKAGEVTISGTIEDLSTKASINVIVEDVAIEDLDDVTVPMGTKLENLELPQQVKVTAFDGTVKNATVDWETAGLVLDQPGNYELTGKIIGIPTEITLNVIVESVEIDTPDSITVMEGTALANVNLPQQVMVTYEDGHVEHVTVDWNTSSLDLQVPGEYVLNGALEHSTLQTSITITVQPEYPDQVRLSQSAATLKEGRTLQLTASITPSNAVKNKVTWSSNNSSVATVDQNGLVTSHTEGTAVITATTENGKNATTTVTVSNRPNLYVNAYASVTINSLIKSMSLQLYNQDTDKFTIEKIEVYERNSLYTTYYPTELQTNGIATEVHPGSSWGMSIEYKLGLWKDNSFVKFYINSNGKVYEFTDNSL